MKVNQIKAGILLSYISMFLSNIISLIYTPVMLRLLGQSEYGLYCLVGSVIGYLGLLSFGFDSAYIRYYSIYKVNNDEDAIARLNGMFLMVFSLLGVVALVAGIILTLNVEGVFGAKLTALEIGKARILMWILVVNTAVSFPLMVYKSFVTANEKYVFQKVLGIIKVVFGPFVALPFLLMGYGSVAMVSVTTAIGIGVSISHVLFCKKKLNMKFSFARFDFRLLREIAVFSSFVFINTIVDQINWSVDKFLLGIYRGTEAVAVYGLAAQLNTYYMNFSTSISSALVPRINRLAADKNSRQELRSIFARVGRIQFILLSFVLTAFAFFGKPFIFMWAGSDYTPSYTIALILITPVTIPLIQIMAMETQRAMNLHKFRAYAYLVIAVLNILVSIPLCKRYGAVGSAIGTAAALIVGNIFIMNIFYNKKMKLDIPFFWSQIAKLLPGLLLPVAIGILIFKFVNIYNVLLFIVFAVIYTLVFVGSMWLFAMNDYEKELVRKPFEKLTKKLTGQA